MYYGQCVDEGHECWRELDDDLDYLRPQADDDCGDGGTDDGPCFPNHQRHYLNHIFLLLGEKQIFFSAVLHTAQKKGAVFDSFPLRFTLPAVTTSCLSGFDLL